MLAELSRRGALIRLHDIGGTITSKLLGVGRAVLAVLTGVRRGDHAYLSVPGQAGVWLFVPLALALRLRGIDHAVHHHSFRPINRGPMRGMRMLVAAGRRRQRHVLLSENMRRRFAALYLKNDPDKAMALSNAYLFAPQLVVADRPVRPVTLGHMSVLTREKGVGYLLDLFASLTARGNDWRLVIAGPCADPALRAEIDAAVAADPDRITYLGPVAGSEKERFFADLDLFVLPTTLVDEAEPLVMLEAFSHGVEVVANDTGCIRDRIRTPGHLLTRDPEADVELIEKRMAEAASDWSATRAACIVHVRGIAAQAEAEAEAVFPRLLPFTAIPDRHLPSTPGL